MTQTSSHPEEGRTASLGQQVGRLAALLASPHYPGGDRAALKRWAPGQPPPLAFYRLWLRHLGTELPAEGQSAAWMTVAWGLALAGEGAHRPGRPLGRALAEAQFAEARLERLLSAPEELRPDLFISAVRFLAAKGEGFDWTEGARFLMTLDADKRESLNRRIAAEYYRHVA